MSAVARLMAVLALLPVALVAVASDVVFVNGRVHTMDAGDRVATALLVRGERIVFVGSDEAARRAAGSGARLIDLHGRLLLPGFRDSHAHPGMVPNPGTQLDVGGLTQSEAILGKIAAFAAAHPEKPWITGTGWDEAAFLPAGQPTRQMLDDAVPGRPAFLSNNSQHMAWVNAAALRAARIDRATPDPANGRVERGADGEPSGVLQEAAMDLVKRVVPAPSIAEQVQDLLTSMATMHRHGITAYEDAMVRPGAVPAYLALARDPRFLMHAHLCMWYESAGDDATQLARFRA